VPEEEKTPPAGSIVQLVTPIQTLNEQLGAHLTGALQRTGTVAVLTSIVPGVGPERVVSVPLSAQQFHAVQSILQQLAAPEEAAAVEAPRSLGFRGEDEE